MTDEELALLREYIQEPLSEEWNDDRLQAMYAAMGGDLKKTAGMFWRSKAASQASLVDISENGSSRKLSDLYKNSLVMADLFDPGEEDDMINSGRPTTRAITRP